MAFIRQPNVMKFMEIEKDLKTQKPILDSNGQTIFKRISFAYCDQNVFKDEIRLIGTSFEKGQDPQDFNKVIKGLNAFDKLEETMRIQQKIRDLKQRNELLFLQ